MAAVAHPRAASVAWDPASRRGSLRRARRAAARAADDPRWVKLRSELQSRSTQVTGGARGAREALNGSEGVVLLDVRPQEEHEEDGVAAAFDGSVTVLNVPLFVRTEAKDLTSGIKLLLGKSLGITPTDENKAFAQEVRAALPASATKLVVACGFGGSIYGNEYSPSTAPSRSITAVGKLLMEAGYESSFVCHCDAPMRELLAAMADEKADAL